MAGKESRYIVGHVSEIPPGSMKLVPVGKFGAGVFNVGGKFYAVTNYCPHRGAPLCLGRITGTVLPGEKLYQVVWDHEGEILRCPWHGWAFDIASGKARLYPEKGAKTYAVTVENDTVVLET